MAETEEVIPPPETAPAQSGAQPADEAQPAGEGEPTDEPTDKPKEEEADDKPPGDEGPTLLDMIGEFVRNVYNNRYKWEIVTTAIMFVIALEIARELKCVAIPLRFYVPFKKLGECFRCIKCILTE